MPITVYNFLSSFFPKKINSDNFSKTIVESYVETHFSNLTAGLGYQIQGIAYYSYPTYLGSIQHNLQIKDAVAHCMVKSKENNLNVNLAEIKLNLTDAIGIQATKQLEKFNNNPEIFTSLINISLDYLSAINVLTKTGEYDNLYNYNIDISEFEEARTIFEQQYKNISN